MNREEAAREIDNTACCFSDKRFRDAMHMAVAARRGGEGMKAKPIIFSTDMVKAILDGRKTQTRRVIKPQPTWDKVITEQEAKDRALSGFDPYGFRINTPTLSEAARKAPYQPGDILWVRETWSPVHVLPKRYLYKADAENGGEGDGLPIRWRPSIHMPREAARLFLRVKNVRVERVQDIGEEDAYAEGVGGVDNFIKLWDTINTKSGLYKWKNNPFVWTICFERVGKDGKVREIESP